MTNKMFTCSTCKIEKPADKFVLDHSVKSGFRAKCRDCSNAEAKARKNKVSAGVGVGNNNDMRDLDKHPGNKIDRSIAIFKEGKWEVKHVCKKSSSWFIKSERMSQYSFVGRCTGCREILETWRII